MNTGNCPVHKNNKRIKALENLEKRIERCHDASKIDRMLDEARTLKERIVSPEVAASKRSKKHRG